MSSAESHRAHLNNIANAFEILQEEQICHLNSNCRAAIRTMTPPLYPRFYDAPESPDEIHSDDDEALPTSPFWISPSHSSPPYTSSSSGSNDDTEATIDILEEYDIIFEKEIPGFVRCRLCKSKCCELKRKERTCLRVMP